MELIVLTLPYLVDRLGVAGLEGLVLPLPPCLLPVVVLDRLIERDIVGPCILLQELRDFLLQCVVRPGVCQPEEFLALDPEIVIVDAPFVDIIFCAHDLICREKAFLHETPGVDEEPVARKRRKALIRRVSHPGI